MTGIEPALSAWEAEAAYTNIPVLLVRDSDEFADASCELRGLHVVGEASETPVAPGAVDRRGRRRLVTEGTPRRDAALADSIGLALYPGEQLRFIVSSRDVLGAMVPGEYVGANGR